MMDKLKPSSKQEVKEFFDWQEEVIKAKKRNIKLLAKEELSEYNNYLLQRFNNYEVPLSMSAEDVRDYIIQFNKEYMKECQACGEEITQEEYDNSEAFCERCAYKKLK